MDSTRPDDDDDVYFGHYHGTLDPKPTRAQPGSEEKIRVMMWRYEQGYCLFHPQDEKMPILRNRWLHNVLTMAMREADDDED